jgi:hypothetical protein
MIEWHSTDRSSRQSSKAPIELDDTAQAEGVERGSRVVGCGTHEP